jgi:hypothetical protein
MGMYGRLRQIPEADLNRALADPAAFYARFDSANKSSIDHLSDELKAQAAWQFQRLQGLLVDSTVYTEMQQKMQLLKDNKISKEESLVAIRRYQEEAARFRTQVLAEAKEFAKNSPPRTPAQAEKFQSPAEPAVAAGLTDIALEKSWHCLHFILTGNAELEAGKFADSPVLGGAEIPDKNGIMGYGPIHYLRPGDVAKKALSLQEFPIPSKAKNYDPENGKALGIYCPDHAPDELEHYFDLLLRFYRDCAANTNAALLWLE